MALPSIVTEEGPEQETLWRRVFSGLPLESAQNSWHAAAQTNSPSLGTVPLKFEHSVSGAGQLGFFYPADCETVVVSCRNHYRNPAMNARTFGMAVTIVWMNDMAHSLASAGQVNTSRIANDLFHRLRNWAFELEGLDHEALYDFLD